MVPFKCEFRLRVRGVFVVMRQKVLVGGGLGLAVLFSFLWGVRLWGIDRVCGFLFGPGSLWHRLLPSAN